MLLFGLHCSGLGTKEEALIHGSPSYCTELQVNETQSVTPWKGPPAHTGVNIYLCKQVPTPDTLEKD